MWQDVASSLCFGVVWSIRVGSPPVAFVAFGSTGFNFGCAFKSSFSGIGEGHGFSFVGVFGPASAGTVICLDGCFLFFPYGVRRRRNYIPPPRDLLSCSPQLGYSTQYTFLPCAWFYGRVGCGRVVLVARQPGQHRVSVVSSAKRGVHLWSHIYGGA